MKIGEIKWPETDKWGTPTEKMPDCPKCGEDELGLITSGYIMCYLCGWQAYATPKMEEGESL